MEEGQDLENTGWENVRGSALQEKCHRAAFHRGGRVGTVAGGSEWGFLRGEGPKAEATFLRTGGEGCKAQCPPSPNL